MIDDPELPQVGVIPIAEGRARWCVWAPRAKRVELVLGEGSPIAMSPVGRGYYVAEADAAGDDLRYAYRLDGGPPLPDPISRSQPEGIDKPSAVYFPERYTWSDSGWTGIARDQLVVSELHVGTFTREGTFEAILARLDDLLDVGITCIELMPVAQFPGSRSWGYDGVFPFAVQNSYGGPEALHRLIDACHARGMAVFLDVVYNHFGPAGNVFPEFGPYLTEKTKSDWGPAVNFDQPGCDPVRAMVLDNVAMWVRDFRVDGLRLDAADQIYDRSPTHILSEIARLAHCEADRRGFPVHIFAETDLNDAPRFLHTTDRGGYGLDGHWNDDFHHAAHVVLTGETDGYYADFAAGPAALVKAWERVFVNDGNFSAFRNRRHGAPAVEFSGDRFLAFTQNHDQIGNRLKSDRHAASLPPAANRMAAGILLLSPRLPLLFMGQEYGETNPFPYFCDYADPELIEMVRSGRKAEFAHFGWNREPFDPVDPATHESAILSWTWADPARAGLRQLHKDLLQFRRDTPFLTSGGRVAASVIEGTTIELKYGDDAASPTIVIFNVGDQPKPLPDAVAGKTVRMRSEISKYGAADDSTPDDRILRAFEFAVLR